MPSAGLPRSQLTGCHQCHGFPALPFLFFDVYGPLQPAGHPQVTVIPTGISPLLTARPPIVRGGGNQGRDLTHVEMVCRS